MRGTRCVGTSPSRHFLHAVFSAPELLAEAGGQANPNDHHESKTRTAISATTCGNRASMHPDLVNRVNHVSYAKTKETDLAKRFDVWVVGAVATIRRVAAAWRWPG